MKSAEADLRNYHSKPFQVNMSSSDTRHGDKYAEMMSVNQRQKEFYETDKEKEELERNLPSRVWKHFRSRLQGYKEKIGLNEDLHKLHRDWVGDLAGKRVLDLGCHSGNRMSVEMAKGSDYYLGVDLSENAIRELNHSIQEVEGAEARAVDFLSDEFKESGFDVVYARSVFHHFEYFDPFLKKLEDHISPGARIITYDPLRTSRPVKLARRLYRPFQIDAEWEFPFNRQSIREIKTHFDIVDLQGFLGAAKWGIPIYLFNKPLGKALGNRLAEIDREQAQDLGPGLWRCMQVTMYLQN
jgi:2-polyprenyl-3-methyl-5-hydroxy-6-metoxy-1,4-benzoquinol methylase